MIETYWKQLIFLAANEVDLRHAFASAGFNSSTFYRARERGDLSLRVAARVARELANGTKEQSGNQQAA